MNRDSFDISTRQDLINILAEANRRYRFIVALEVLAIILICCLGLDWQFALRNLGISLLIVMMMLGPTCVSLLRLVFLNKKAVKDLKDDFQLGNFRKSDLMSLLQDVQVRLGLNANKVRVYITREKDLNAAAIQVGLARFFPALNAIFINRAALHCLNREELSGLMAHEIAHNEKYYLLKDRLLFLHLGFAVLLGLYARQIFSGDTTFELLAPLACAALLEYASGRYRGRYSHLLEYLCDDAGASISGVAVAIGAEYKIAVRTEAHRKVINYALRKKVNGAQLSSKQALAEVEAALPFGLIDQEQVRKQIDIRIDEIDNKASTLSLKGFLNYIGLFENYEAQKGILEELEKNEALEKIPLIEFKSDLTQSFTESQARELVEAIQKNPDKVLFHTESDLHQLGSSHPGIRQRMLYLWCNRESINKGVGAVGFG